MEDAGRNQVQDALLAIDHERVAGVVAALVSRDKSEVRRQQVDNLALALISELGAEDDYVHSFLLWKLCPGWAFNYAYYIRIRVFLQEP